MRFYRPAALAAAVAAVALTAACASAPAVRAHPTALMLSGAGSADPAVFAAGIDCPPAGSVGIPCSRLAVLSSRTGTIVRWLTPRVTATYDSPVSILGSWVYFLRANTAGKVGIWRVPLAGGPVQLVQAGTADWSMSQDGHAVAYVISSPYREELITRNRVTGQRNTIIIATNPQGDDNNWPPDATDLTWSPDDTHLALALAPTAAISSVLTLDAFTATSIKDATTAPAPCPVADVSPRCTETNPAYLADGALSYTIGQTTDQGGTGPNSLVTWRGGRSTIVHVFASGLPELYDMTPQGQAIWIGNPARQGGPFPIWCWSGGPVTKIAAVPATDPPDGVAWLLSYNHAISDADFSCSSRLRRYCLLNKRSVALGVMDVSCAAHSAADVIRERILAGDLRPGSPLREVTLAAELDISRNSLREGLRVLSAEGLVEQVPNKGTTVSRLTMPAVRDIYRARRVLEVQAATESATASPGWFAAMEASVRDEERAEQAEAWRAALTAGLRFHRALVAMLGSCRLDDFFRGLLAQLRLAWAEAGEDHHLEQSWAARDRELYELLRTGRRSQGVGALLVYLADSENQVLDVLRGRCETR